MAFVSKDPHLNPAMNTAAHVYVIRFDDATRLEKINGGAGGSSTPVWSPDGKHLTSIPARNPVGFLSYKVWDVGLSQPRKRDFPLDS